MYCFYFIRSEIKKIAVRFSTIVSKQREQGVQALVNLNKIKFEPYCDLVDQAFSQFNENSLITSQNPHSQIENDETPGAEYHNENDSEETETNKTSPIANFLPKILPDDEITEGIDSLNLKQYNGHDVEPVHIILSGS